MTAFIECKQSLQRYENLFKNACATTDPKQHAIKIQILREQIEFCAEKICNLQDSCPDRLTFRISSRLFTTIPKKGASENLQKKAAGLYNKMLFQQDLINNARRVYQHGNIFKRHLESWQIPSEQNRLKICFSILLHQIAFLMQDLPKKLSEERTVQLCQTYSPLQATKIAEQEERQIKSIVDTAQALADRVRLFYLEHIGQNLHAV